MFSKTWDKEDAISPAVFSLASGPSTITHQHSYLFSSDENSTAPGVDMISPIAFSRPPGAYLEELNSDSLCSSLAPLHDPNEPTYILNCPSNPFAQVKRASDEKQFVEDDVLSVERRSGPRIQFSYFIFMANETH